MVDLKTDRQKWVEKRRQKVVALYKELKETSNGSNTAIINYMAEELSAQPDMAVTAAGIRHILKKAELL